MPMVKIRKKPVVLDKPTKPYTAPFEGVDIKKVQELVGKESGKIEGPDRVCRSMIRQWCEVMEDANPLYWDEEYASKSKYGGIIAPPTMNQAWTLDPLWPEMEFPWMPHDVAVEMFDEAGYTEVVATEQTMEFIKPLRLGDKVSAKIKFVGVSPYEHKTPMGAGHYLDILYTFTNQNDEVVGTLSFRFLKYKPWHISRQAYEG